MGVYRWISDLHRAVIDGKIDCVLRSLESQSDLETKNSKGDTPLILAVRHGKYGIIEILLQNGAAVNVANDEGWTPIHYAAQKGIGVDRLLQCNANPNVLNNDGSSPLLIASAEGFTNVVLSLLDAGADPNVTLPGTNRSPLQILARKGHLDAVTHLVEKGANVDWRDTDNLTAMSYAIRSRRSDVAIWLLKINTDKHCGAVQSNLTCPLALAIAHKLDSVIHAIFHTGFDKAHARSSLQDQSILDTICKQSYRHYTTMFSAPLPLKMLCRLEIRHHACTRIRSDIWKKWNLPTPVKEYLLLNELNIDY